MKRTLGRYFPGTILLALVSILSPTSAYASIIAKASNSTAQSITSAAWKVAPEILSTDSTTGIQSWTSTSKNQYLTGFYKNIGSLDVTGFSWSIIQTVVSGSGAYTLTSCRVNQPFNTTTGLCADGFAPSPLGLSGTNGPALTQGSVWPIQIKLTKSGNTFTYASSVSTANIRGGTNTVA